MNRTRVPAAAPQPRRVIAVIAATALTMVCGSTSAQNDGEPGFRDLYRELIEINTTLSAGDCSAAAKAMSARLSAAGFADRDLQILGPADHPREQALIATLHGSSPKLEAVLLLAHIDVVEARREDWQRDPFKLVEEDGWFYARGASDDKAMAAVFTDAMIRYRTQGYKPRRDIKLALTCGEETSEHFNSVRWLLQNQPAALQAAFALNEGAGGELDAAGKPVSLQIQAGEKVYEDFELSTTSGGGHSSRPVPDNAIYRLAAGLMRLSAYPFPLALNEATRGYFEAQSKLVAPDVAADIQAVLKTPPDTDAQARLWAANPMWNSMLRTTCVATQLSGGHAPNALPQRATANVNCRILPGVPVAEVQKTLAMVLADDKIAIKPSDEPVVVGPAPPLTAQIMQPVRKIADTIWPGVAIVPTMSTGATDGRFLNAAGIPTYGLSGMFHDAEGSHMHGLNERIRVKSLMDGRVFLYEIVKIYGSQK
ncbi:MAG: peptidase [Hydrocarboniphaga sp.]|uniref:M20/M25/M40 family metallo-hydrolase n=1 Tax=Hydrocarboniphaga sp. TaxID=2033016 RepID=UPI0026389652|nr:M20/M25/M40 family metallo-hydrolase [Hydrocarboniphaga sp.]MDB5970806.1 peptidase [Hydrocarboniphaga sp.]